MNIDWLDIKKLRYLVTVAEELSFSAAARKLHMAQPPLSQQIKKIELRLGFDIFDRSTRKVVLTRRGAMIITYAKNVLVSHQQFALELSQTSNLPLKLGVSSLAFDAFISQGLANFVKANKATAIDLVEGSSNHLMAQVDDNKLDGAVVRLFKPQRDNADLFLLFQEPYVVAYPKSWQFESKDKKVCLTQLHGREYISYPRELHPLLYDEIERVFAQNGCQPNMVLEIKSKAATLSLVASGLGFAIVPKSIAKRFDNRVNYFEIEQALPSVDYYLYCKSPQSHPLLRALLKSLKET